jgi:hypothetical protein
MSATTEPIGDNIASHSGRVSENLSMAFGFNDLRGVAIASYVLSCIISVEAPGGC